MTDQPGVYVPPKALFMPPTLKKWGAYCFWLVCVCVRSVVLPFKKISSYFLKFHIWIPRQKIAYPYFFLGCIISPCRVMPLLRAKSAIL